MLRMSAIVFWAMVTSVSGPPTTMPHSHLRPISPLSVMILPMISALAPSGEEQSPPVRGLADAIALNVHVRVQIGDDNAEVTAGDDVPR